MHTRVRVRVVLAIETCVNMLALALELTDFDNYMFVLRDKKEVLVIKTDSRSNDRYEPNVCKL